MATLSVVLTNYNHGQFIGRAIDAIVSQERPPDEFIIQDDGSTDNSIDIIMPYVSKYRYIRFVKNDKNLGHIPAMQKVCSYAEKDYIYGASSDDYILPGFFKKAMELLEKYPQAGLCCGDIYDYNARTEETAAIEMNLSIEPAYFTPEMLADTLAGKNIHGGIMRRDAFLKTGGFIDKLKWHSDWFYTHVIAFRNGMIYLPQKVTVTTSCQKGSFCFEGIMNQPKQAAVLREAIRLLKTPEYIDVFPYFALSAAFSIFGQFAVKVAMENDDLQDIPASLLLQHSLYIWNHEIIAERNKREKKSTENKLSIIIGKINLLIQNGNIDTASDLLDNLQEIFGKKPEIDELKSRISTVRRVINAHAKV